MQLLDPSSRVDNPSIGKTIKAIYLLETLIHHAYGRGVLRRLTICVIKLRELHDTNGSASFLVYLVRNSDAITPVNLSWGLRLHLQTLHLPDRDPHPQHTVYLEICTVVDQELLFNGAIKQLLRIAE